MPGYLDTPLLPSILQQRLRGGGPHSHQNDLSPKCSHQCTSPASSSQEEISPVTHLVNDFQWEMEVFWLEQLQVAGVTWQNDFCACSLCCCGEGAS